MRKRLPHSPCPYLPFVCPEPVASRRFSKKKKKKKGKKTQKWCGVSQVTVVSPSAVEAAAAAGIGGVLEDIPIGGDSIY